MGDLWGGFWYEDLKDRKLVRFKKENNSISIIEEIKLKDYIPSFFNSFKPMSCMTICDNKNPVMLISAIKYFFKKYILAIDLMDNNKLLWSVKTDNIGINYAGGQFTILKKNNNSSDNRIVFGTYWNGVMAIG
jgi:hypothetical protein